MSYREGHWDIYLANGDGSGAHVLVDCPTSCFQPQWSPDGEWIAYGGGRSETRGLYLVRPDGTGNHQITSSGCGRTSPYGPCVDGWPSWSPDGRRIAFVRGQPYTYCSGFGDCPVIHVVNSDGTGLRQLVAGWTPQWSPDGRTIAYATDASPDCSPYSLNACDASIRVIRPDGTGARTLAVTGDEPRWSPDGSRLLISRYRPGQTDGVESDLWLARSDGTGAQQLTHLGVHEGAFAPTWTPDGSAVIYSGYRSNNDTCDGCTGQDSDWELFRLELRGGALKQLTDAYGWDHFPSVEPT